MSCTRSRTGGISSTSPMNPSSNPKIPRPTKASTNKVSAGNNENAVFQVDPLNQLGKGRIHPPSHSVTAIDETASIAAYSARKNNDQRKPLYSVWKPATNSDSASGRSKGARLVSATMAMAKTMKAMKPNGKNLKMNQT